MLQKTVAAKLRVNIETLKNWERGVGSPSVRQLPRIIEFLGYDPEPVPEDLAGRIRYARRRLGLTQEEMAKALGVDTVSLWRWETERILPPWAILEAMQTMLNRRRVPVATLF